MIFTEISQCEVLTFNNLGFLSSMIYFLLLEYFSKCSFTISGFSEMKQVCICMFILVQTRKVLLQGGTTWTHACQTSTWSKVFEKYSKSSKTSDAVWFFIWLISSHYKYYLKFKIFEWLIIQTQIQYFTKNFLNELEWPWTYELDDSSFEPLVLSLS